MKSVYMREERVAIEKVIKDNNKAIRLINRRVAGEHITAYAVTKSRIAE